MSPQISRSSCASGLSTRTPFEIFYGVSDNAASFWDNSRAAHFGYRPQGRAEDYRQAALAAQAKLPPDPIGARYQGGPFCSAEYDADKRG